MTHEISSYILRSMKQPVVKKEKKRIICPDDKELNPNTNRCVKKCKPGEQRDEKFQCKSAKKQLQQHKTRKSRTPSSSQSSTSSSILRISPGNMQLENAEKKLTKDDIKRILHNFIDTNHEYSALITKQSNIKDDAADVLVNYINRRTPSEYREILHRLDLLETYQREVKVDTDEELILWIVHEIMGLLLNRLRDMGRKIITKEILERFMLTNDFIKLLDE